MDEPPAARTSTVLTRWWGNYPLESHEVLELALGPLTLWITRREREWRVGAERSDDTLRPGARIRTFSPREVVAEDSVIPEDDTWERFAQSATSGRLSVTPCLMERTFVVRPYAKLHLLPGERVVVYVTTPVAVRLSEEGSAIPMVEVPVTRPSETWRGANTMEGSVCYSGRTHARLLESKLELRESRAVTAITLDNQSVDPYWVDHLPVPVPRLGLWEQPDTHALHTDSVWVVRERGDQGSERVEIRPGAPCPGALPVARPRVAQRGVSVLRMLSNLWELGS